MHLLFLRARDRQAFYALVLMQVVSCVFLGPPVVAFIPG
jgi:hypothetical protein